jgi:hypothetical protein
MRHLLPHPLKRRNAMRLELSRDRIDIGLRNLIARAFRAAGIMRITALMPSCENRKPSTCGAFNNDARILLTWKNELDVSSHD